MSASSSLIGLPCSFSVPSEAISANTNSLLFGVRCDIQPRGQNVPALKSSSTGVLLFFLNHRYSHSLLISTMTDPSTGRAIAKALRASLRLTSGSSKLLSLSQLYAVKDDLRGTLTLVEGEICAAETGKRVR